VEINKGNTVHKLLVGARMPRGSRKGLEAALQKGCALTHSAIGGEEEGAQHVLQVEQAHVVLVAEIHGACNLDRGSGPLETVA
jgi:hypothetical protein